MGSHPSAIDLVRRNKEKKKKGIAFSCQHLFPTKSQTSNFELTLFFLISLISSNQKLARRCRNPTRLVAHIITPVD